MASIGIGLFVIKMTNNPRAGKKLHNFRRRNLTLHPATKDWFVKIVQTFISSEKNEPKEILSMQFYTLLPASKDFISSFC